MRKYRKRTRHNKLQLFALPVLLSNGLKKKKRVNQTGIENNKQNNIGMIERKGGDRRSI